MGAPASILGIAEVVLNVVDIETMSAFYREVLGLAFHSDARLPAEEDGDERPTIVFLRVMDPGTPLSSGDHPQLLALIDPARHGPAQGQFAAVRAAASTLNHLAFEIAPDDHDRELARLDELGLAPRVVEFPHMAARAIFFYDPEGNTLELISHDPELIA
ncbi:MAG: VOC family protein [Thermoanaerobaculia bacterium]|nr:VOC family protein [Thermoanaerobaculia bacterium]